MKFGTQFVLISNSQPGGMNVRHEICLNKSVHFSVKIQKLSLTF